MASFYDTVIPLIKGKRILDAGSIGHSYEGRTAFKTWNFGVVHQHASEITGFDLLSNEVSAARKDGWDIEVGDAETFRTSPIKYQVVFAGDLIEHLSNPGLFLECSWDNLEDNGQLIIATPNTYAFAKLARVIVRRTNEPPVNPEHTFYFTPLTLEQLVSRHRFRLKQILYSDLDYAPNHGTVLKRLLLSLNSRMSSMAPRFSQTMVAVFDKMKH
jgi:hypothetical protein